MNDPNKIAAEIVRLWLGPNSLSYHDLEIRIAEALRQAVDDERLRIADELVEHAAGFEHAARHHDTFAEAIAIQLHKRSIAIRCRITRPNDKRRIKQYH